MLPRKRVTGVLLTNGAGPVGVILVAVAVIAFWRQMLFLLTIGILMVFFTGLHDVWTRLFG